MSPAARYLCLVLASCALVLGAVLALNLALAARAEGGPEVTRLAAQWQRETQGVTYPPPMLETRPFKILRLHDRLPEINAMVLGASTAMSITQAMLPPALRVYNFALVSNPTAAVVGEAEYVAQHFGGGVRWLLIALDWSIGFIYLDAPPPALALTPQAALAADALPALPWHKRLEDALALPRVRALGLALWRALRSGDAPAALRQTFFQAAGNPYRCADGALARDFDVVSPGACVGYRHDGSWTFGGQRRLSPAQAAVLARGAAAPSSKFAQYLVPARGEPNPVYLQRLGRLARALRQGGGQVLFLLPPLVPGLEREMLATRHAGPPLEHTKRVLEAWAREGGFVVLDAGQSERFGCLPGEFLDEHHAWPECYRRVLGRFFADEAAGRVAPGLYAPGAGS